MLPKTAKKGLNDERGKHRLKEEKPGRWYEKKWQQLRRDVNELHFEKQMSKSAIARKKRVSRNFVRKWTQSEEQDFEADRRGWPKGKRRKWSVKEELRVREIHERLVSDPRQYYRGATVIAQHWWKRYPGENIPPLRTIGQILSDLGLSQPNRRGRNRGAARYLCYPEYTLYENLGKRLLEADFVGHKYIKGKSVPLNFIGFSFKKQPRIRHYQRVEGQTATVIIEQCRRFFCSFEKPDSIKVDNAPATIGSSSGKRTISRFIAFVLGQRVMPIFSVPRKPFSQASIEGNNSVFSRLFWKREIFASLEQLDEKLRWFNDSSLEFTGYQPPPSRGKKEKPFVPKVLFVRQVRQLSDHREKGFIDVLHESIELPPSLINYFVLAEWNLLSEQLVVSIEKEKKLQTLDQRRFAINRNSKKKRYAEIFHD